MSIQGSISSFSNFYFKIYVIALIFIVAKYTQVTSTDPDNDMQLVALEEDETDFNNLNQGKLFFRL